MADITLTLTHDEALSCYGGLSYETGYYGAPPNPPTPAMTAQAKLAKALGLAE